MDIGARVSVTDSAGASVTTGQPEVNGTHVTQPLAGARVQDETYRVIWRIVSSDGHPIEGTFTYQVGDGAGTADPATPSSTPAQSADTAAQAAQGEDGTSTGTSASMPLWVIGAAGAVLALAMTVLVSLVRRRG
jgi:hypothetical protein